MLSYLSRCACDTQAHSFLRVLKRSDSLILLTRSTFLVYPGIAGCSFLATTIDRLMGIDSYGYITKAGC